MPPRRAARRFMRPPPRTRPRSGHPVAATRLRPGPHRGAAGRVLPRARDPDRYRCRHRGDLLPRRGRSARRRDLVLRAVHPRRGPRRRWRRGRPSRARDTDRTPRPWFRAFSTRFVRMRFTRRLSVSTGAAASRGSISTTKSPPSASPTVCNTNSPRFTGSSSTPSTPASARASSSSSETRRSNRCTSAPNNSSGSRMRAGRSAARDSSTSADAARVVSGDRSSWLTSDANRASRSKRCWSASTMRLKDPANGSRSASPRTSRRCLRSPAAMADAVVLTSRSGASTRRAAQTPSNAAAIVVNAAAASSAFRITRSVLASSWRTTISK